MSNDGRAMPDSGRPGGGQGGPAPDEPHAAGTASSGGRRSEPQGDPADLAGHGSEPMGDSRAVDPYLHVVEAMLRCAELVEHQPTEVAAALEAGVEPPAFPELDEILSAASESAEHRLAATHPALAPDRRRAACETAVWWVGGILNGDGQRPLALRAKELLNGPESAVQVAAVAEALDAVRAAVHLGLENAGALNG